MSAVVFIPARMASTRLPGKPLADIAGKPMIVHVWERAVQAGLGPVYVAAAEQEIVDAVKKAGGEAVLTKPEHPSGTDRIFEALQALDPKAEKFDMVINVQGDLPLIEPKAIKNIIYPLEQLACDMATLVADLKDQQERENPNVVKALAAFKDKSRPVIVRDFTRQTPANHVEAYHHIGLYGYRRAALERFTKLPPSPREQAEKLEQLRALEHKMKIGAAYVKSVPLGVDTEEDLAYVRSILELRT